ncbi:uncharacterized protein N7500_010433 [Penicillium coprophilum]|uniref:uncharacterized protein n=1 Tax=Penicillium coprophilum TaxID=36646 RepID=UPI002383E343|nr:uncharacterized protein N7500_010433 [Penicillium coprophilum]KAJ5154994.1 hypothetical protein N7500_010433 [Penicillium coprophilum]
MTIFVPLPLPSDQQIDEFEDIVLKRSYHVTNRSLIREALQGSALSNPAGKILSLSGDAILRHILVDQGRDRNKSPEEIQNVITIVASNNNLWNRGIAIGLDPFLVRHPGQQGIPVGKNVMANSMEAIIGAVYYDSDRNLEDCERVMAILGLSWPE